jgi:hypothetical protein
MRRIVGVLLCLILACAACTSSKDELREILTATQPSNTVSLYQYAGTSSSATGGGGHTFVKSLYATQQTDEEIFEAYREQLSSDGWEQFTEGVWRKNQPNGMYQITVEDVRHWIRMPGLDTIPQNVIADGLHEYETLFIVSTYHFP